MRIARVTHLRSYVANATNGNLGKETSPGASLWPQSGRYNRRGYINNMKSASKVKRVVEPISEEHFLALKRTAVLPNGLRLSYVEMGDPNGVPVLLLHGFTDSARSWSLTAP